MVRFRKTGSIKIKKPGRSYTIRTPSLVKIVPRRIRKNCTSSGKKMAKNLTVSRKTTRNIIKKIWEGRQILIKQELFSSGAKTIWPISFQRMNTPFFSGLEFFGYGDNYLMGKLTNIKNLKLGQFKRHLHRIRDEIREKVRRTFKTFERRMVK